MSIATQRRVLIVDDSREDRVALRRFLGKGQGSALAIDEAANGEEGLGQCRQHLPDCVLLDYNLPDLDGIEFLTRLKQEHGAAAPAVVMLTGQGNEALAVRALKLGAQDYLVKGMADTGVLRAVHSAIDNALLRRQVLLHKRSVESLSAERLGLLEDLQKRAAELDEAARRKDEFLATLAHELRNPLAPIRNSLLVLREGKAEGAQARALHDMLHRQVNHMVRLIDDLMEVSRITRGEFELRRECMDLNAILLHAVEISKPLVEGAGHRLEISLSSEPLVVQADTVRLAQIFSNLINNAAKYTHGIGTIWLTARREGGEAVVSVRDDGMGISADMLDKVFELFTQVDRSIGKGSGGLGIGLTLAKRLTEMHGGRIESRSEGLGKGSEFVVRLPSDEAGTLPEKPDGFMDKPAGNSSHRVLVVDDNKDAAASLEMLLSTKGVEVHVEHDGPAALRAIRRFAPTIALLDIGMPGMNGYELARKIREDDAFADVHLVALTGWGQPGDVRQAKEAGFDRHCVKPVDLDVLEGLLSSS